MITLMFLSVCLFVTPLKTNFFPGTAFPTTHIVVFVFRLRQSHVCYSDHGQLPLPPANPGRESRNRATDELRGATEDGK